MSAEIVIVHGPQACGKTRNSAALMKHFGCNKITDDWYNGRCTLKPGTLALTTDAPPFDVKGAKVVSFSDAMKAIRSRP